MKSRFFPYDVLALVALGQALNGSAVIGVVKLVGPSLIHWASADHLAVVFLAAMNVVDIALVAWVIGVLGFKADVLSLRNWPRALALGLAAGIALRVGVRPEWFAFKGVPASALGWQTYLDAVLIAPIVESVFWCGAVYAALRQRHSWVLALLVSAAGFTLSHDYMWLHKSGSLGGHASFIWGAFSTGMITAVGFNAAYAMTGSLVAPIVAHLIYNL